jgi:hypothetical protein
MKKQVDTIDLTPTPEVYVNQLLIIIHESKIKEDVKFAYAELVRAMTIAMGVKEEMNGR